MLASYYSTLTNAVIGTGCLRTCLRAMLAGTDSTPISKKHDGTFLELPWKAELVLAPRDRAAMAGSSLAAVVKAAWEPSSIVEVKTLSKGLPRLLAFAGYCLHGSEVAYCVRS